MDGVDFEVSGRFDKVGKAAKPSIGRSGPPKFKWELLEWQPPRKRTYRDSSVAAWATAKR